MELLRISRAWTWAAVIFLLCISVHGDMDDSTTMIMPLDITGPDDIEQIADWKDRCRTRVGEQAVKDIEDSQKNLLPCITKIIKWDKLQHEINRSIPRGQLDLVFKKYCGRRDSLMECVEDMFTKLDVCMDERERQDLNITRAAIDAGLDFVCYKDGDRIALFMGEKGGECVKSQKDNIRNCIEERVPEMKEAEADPFAISINKLTINEENCKKVNTMHQCIVTWTEKCEDSTPSNILDSLIVQILKVTPCKQTSGATTLLPWMLMLLGAALTAANILL
ncbi:27 kDa hemolymph glycoprotein-like [Macrobrachium nipponense]|uniref:27 kDa hemolymph glycoprotein-like n=1 Tax=Macrobrachium nipponense TaxID=159736 RepID=UPI0030C81522